MTPPKCQIPSDIPNQIMDPKMDSGFLQPGETLEDAYDALAPLLPEEVIGIVDQLLCHEMAWHTGYPLSQTLFTSVYIDKLLWPDPKALEQAQFYRGYIPESKRPGPLLEVLRAYCLAVVKCCDFLIAKITSQNYFEEEDFCTQTYNRALFHQVPIDVFLRELDNAIERLDEYALAQSTLRLVYKADRARPELTMNEAVKGALIARLEFRKAFLSALDPDLPLTHLDRCWPPVLASLPALNTTHQLGKPVPGSFSTKIQRRLASTVPPRPIVELDFKDAFDKLKQLSLDCEEATRFWSVPKDPLQYEAFLWSFASRYPAPLTYARSTLSTILMHDDCLNSTPALPTLDFRTLVFPSYSPVMDPVNWSFEAPINPALPKPPHLRIALLIDEFCERAGNPFLEYWTALGQNPCRLRRLLTHVIMAWDMLQSDAALIDEDLTAAIAEMDISDLVLENPLTTWTYHKKLFILSKIILLGFDQDVYLPDEYAGMYHFLSLISAKRVAVLQTIAEHFTHSARRQNNHKMAKDVEKDTEYIQALLHYAIGVQHLSSALGKLYTILLYLHLVPRPKRPFSSPELRYELRMRPFLTLQPPEVPSYVEFNAQTQPFGDYDNPSSELRAALNDKQGMIWRDIEVDIRSAKDSFGAVKRAGPAAMKAAGVLETWEADVKGVLASCVALGVTVVGVRGAVAGADVGVEGRTSGLGVKVEIPGIGGGRYADGWAVPKVVKV